MIVVSSYFKLKLELIYDLSRKVVDMISLLAD